MVLVVLAGGSAVATAHEVNDPRSDAGNQPAPSTPVAGSVALDGPGEAPPAPSAAPLAPGPELDVPVDPTARPSATTVPLGAHIQVPILTYHYIRENPEPVHGKGWDLSVEPPEFALQMAYLRAAGAHTVTLGDVYRALHGGPGLPARPVVLTFDDGYADFATAAAPVLERNGLVGTDFVVGDFIGRPNYMTAEQVLNVASHGMVIGAHTMHHIALAAAPPELAHTEIVESKHTLEVLLGRPVEDFAYPYGSHNPAVVKEVGDAGFRDAVTTDPGNVQFLSARLELVRTRVGAGDTVTSFAHKALLPAPPPDLIPQSTAVPVAPPPPPPPTPPAPPAPPAGGTTTVLIPLPRPSPSPSAAP